MSNNAWPLSQFQDDHVPTTDGRVLLGGLAESEFARAVSEFYINETIILMNDDLEAELWEQLPPSIALLGCGASARGGLALGLNAISSGNLSELIPAVASVQIQTLVREDPLVERDRCRLAPGEQVVLPLWLHRAISSAANEVCADRTKRTPIAAGLHLLYDDLDGSHALSQTVEGRGKNRNGDYWHAIMHRREPDYGNSQYWFRRVGSHPVFAELPAVLERVRKEFPDAMLEEWATRLISNGRWDPMAFVDACEAAAGHPTETAFRKGLEEIQHFEMLHLLVQSCVDAAA